MMNLVTKNPDIAAEWHEDNSERPEEVSPRSTTPARWRCSECGSEWEQAPRPRFYSNNPAPGCRSCKLSRKRAAYVEPEESLAGLYPEVVAAVWHPDNTEDPKKLPPRSGKEVRWLCSCGKEWTASPHSQTRKKDPTVGPGCLHGKGSRTFASEHPDLVQFWHPSNPVGAGEVAPTSTRVVLWALPDGSTLERSVHAVATSGHVVPDLPKHPVSMEPYAPQYMEDNPVAAWRLGRSSKEPVRWRCARGHVYETSPFNRFNGMGHCPECRDAEKLEKEGARREEALAEAARRAEEKRAAQAERQELRERRREEAAAAARERLLERLRSEGRLLSQVAPAVASQLVSEDPDTVAAGSGTPHTWECAEGHRWEATPHDRVGKGAGCPVCAGRRLEPGVNDLVTMFPDIADSWHPDNPCGPHEVLAGSNTNYRWLCSTCGTTWVTQPSYRCYVGYGCPRCAHNGPSAGENEVAEFVAGVTGVGEVRRSVRGLLGDTNMELDIFLPDKAVAVEYNGLFWHSTATGTEREYHLDKYRLARDAGIRLIHVWEDDWKLRRTAVEALLTRAIYNDPQGLSASECSLDTAVGEAESAELLSAWSLHGAAPEGCALLGLRAPDGELVAVLAGKPRRGDWHLERFAAARPVTGGFQRLVRAVLAVHAPQQAVAVADNGDPVDAVYAAAGFVRDGDISPEETRLVEGVREHFTGSPRRVGVFPSIFDAGKSRWVLDTTEAL